MPPSPAEPAPPPPRRLAGTRLGPVALLDLDAAGARLAPRALLEIDARGDLVALDVARDDAPDSADGLLPPPGPDEAELWLPGVVNAHTHLELTGLDRAIPTTPSFPEWGDHVFRYKRGAGAWAMEAGAREGVRRTLAAGVTAVGDITTCLAAPRALATSPLRAVSFAEAIAPSEARVADGLGAFRALLAAVEEMYASHAPRLRAGVSPHAPHTVVAAAMEAIGTREAAAGRAVSIHVAETEAELAYLERGEGEWRAFFEEVGLIGAGWEPPRRGPVACCDVGALLPARRAPYAAAGLRERVEGRAGAVAPHTILAHGNYLADAEVALLAGREAAVCWCPETHHFFYHAPWPHAIRHRLPVLLGTDSLASAWSLDPLVQVSRALRKLATWGAADAWPVADLLAAVTLRARDALLGREAGAPPPADLTILRWRGEPARRLRAALEAARGAGGGEAPVADEALLRALFGPESGRVRRAAGCVIGGVLHAAAPPAKP